MNWQEISIYVATPAGVYLYDAKASVLEPVVAGDFRAATGTQSVVKDAAVNLVYVSDLSKTGGAASSEAEMYTAADVGFIAQNVYLYCASEGLATVVRASIDKPRQDPEVAAAAKDHLGAVGGVPEEVVRVATACPFLSAPVAGFLLAAEASLRMAA